MGDTGRLSYYGGLNWGGKPSMEGMAPDIHCHLQLSKSIFSIPTEVLMCIFFYVKGEDRPWQQQAGRSRDCLLMLTLHNDGAAAEQVSALCIISIQVSPFFALLVYKHVYIVQI